MVSRTGSNRVDEFLDALIAVRAHACRRRLALSMDSWAGVLETLKQSKLWRILQRAAADGLRNENPARRCPRSGRRSASASRCNHSWTNAAGRSTYLEQATDLDRKRIKRWYYRGVFPQTESLIAYAKAFSREARTHQLARRNFASCTQEYYGSTHTTKHH